jgi:hypothetical protein
MEMLGLFFLGALGALLTVYIAKQEVIPEFRPLFETSEKEQEARDHQDHIAKTEKHIDEVQTKLATESIHKDVTERLTIVLNTSLSELQAERARLQVLEREIKQSQLIRRGLGFLFYIGLGGVFGYLLAGRVKVEGLSGDLPSYFQSIVIGATWTSYLSTIGFRSGQKKADERIEAGQKQSAEKFEALKKELTHSVVEVVANAEKAEKVEHPVRTDKVAREVADKIDLAKLDFQKNLILTRNLVRRDVQGIL